VGSAVVGSKALKKGLLLNPGMARGELLPFVLLALLAILTLPPCLPQAGAEVVIVDLHMDIDAGAEELVRRAISRVRAKPGDVGAVVLELDTYGGWAHIMDKIIGMISDCPATTVAFVPEGGNCFSAGAYIFMACDVTAMAPGTAVGSCMPVDALGNPADEKTVNAMAAKMRALAEAHGRNATAAEAMVFNADYTAEEALRLGVCDMVVSDLDELLSKLGLAGAARTYITGRGDAYVQLLSLISNPLLQSIMMWLALWLIIIDIFHPTFVLTVIALALLALALWGVGVIGTHPLAVALVILGSALTLVELKKPGIGFEAVGVLMVLLGVLLAYQFEPFMVLGGAEMAILLVVLAGGAVLAYYLFAMRLALRRRPEHHAPERLIGMLGTAKTPIGPGKPGVVLVASEEWTAVSNEEIPQGAKVRIIKVEGLKLEVKREA